MKNIMDSALPNLKLVRKGKVREVYETGNCLLIVASDRISAFDVIMNELIPNKGKILTEISEFWFEKTAHIIPNHVISTNVDEYPTECSEYEDLLNGRSMLVHKCQPLAVEFVVRGYITGSGWKDYKKTGGISDIELPENLIEFQKLSEPIFTPSTKASEGHDEAINFEETSNIIGIELANYLKDIAIKIYSFAAEYLEKRELILADTKFEFGINEDGKPILIDEVLTPDSSRFWLKETYQPGKFQMNFDKQALRDYLETSGWNKLPPPPPLPESIIKITSDKYMEALQRIIK
ncbi:MAG: phosphoribosylaminoimidazolesuccinocarboxamide synthase [Candidatus Kapabacteria bacterium]|nr:phosphoribosylaminoimidazolesuccinocarboxamide synthase [Candidatus Kapabacteria bacterium]